MLITSNRSVGEWGTVFGDPVVATAILDRLLHHSHVITIRGDSYRLREKRRSGLIKPATLDAGPARMSRLTAARVLSPSGRLRLPPGPKPPYFHERTNQVVHFFNVATGALPDVV